MEFFDSLYIQPHFHSGEVKVLHPLPTLREYSQNSKGVDPTTPMSFQGKEIPFQLSVISSSNGQSNPFFSARPMISVTF